MGWFSDLFKKLTQKNTDNNYAEVLTGGLPIFSQSGTGVYTSDVVQQAITCIVSEIKKLRPQHIVEKGEDVTSVNDYLQRILNKPNPVMTTSDFLEKVTWLLYLNYNAFIIPTYYEWTDDRGVYHKRYDGLYPIQPSEVTFIQDNIGALFVRFKFVNNTQYTVRYSDVIHLKYRYSVNEYMGGNANGQPDNMALLKTIKLNDQLLDGVSYAVKSSYSVNGIVKYNTILDAGKTEEAIKELEDKLRKSESGILPLDLKAEFIPLSRNVQLVDANTLKFIDEKILRHFGVPLSILTGDYTKAQYEAFYQKTIEPLIISFSQEFTRVLFTDTELSYGNKIHFYPKDLIFMSVDQTIEMVTLLSNTGALYENEKRVAFGLMPLPELEGKRYMSLNWVDSDIANQYQTDTDGGNSDE